MGYGDGCRHRAVRRAHRARGTCATAPAPPRAGQHDDRLDADHDTDHGAGPGVATGRTRYFYRIHLPDGLVIADENGGVIRFDAAAADIIAVPAAAALGRHLESALPLEDLEGRRWWQLTDPYGGLAIRVGQPSRFLLLPRGT